MLKLKVTHWHFGSGLSHSPLAVQVSMPSPSTIILHQSHTYHLHHCTKPVAIVLMCFMLLFESRGGGHNTNLIGVYVCVCMRP